MSRRIARGAVAACARAMTPSVSVSSSSSSAAAASARWRGWRKPATGTAAGLQSCRELRSTTGAAAAHSSTTTSSSSSSGYAFATAMSRAPALEDAVAEAVAECRRRLPRDASATWVQLFVSGDAYGDDDVRQAGEKVRALFGSSPALIGGVVRACVGGEGQTTEGVSITAASMPGAHVTTFRTTVGALPALDARTWTTLAKSSANGDTVGAVVLAEASFSDVDDVLQRLHVVMPNSVILGGVVDQGCVMFVDDDAYTEGAVGILLRGDFELDTHIAHGARPVGPVMSLTHAQGGAVLELDDSPAHPLLLETLEALPEQSKSMPVMLGIGAHGAEAGGPFICRDILSVGESGGVEVASVELEEGAPVQLHVRDAAWATEQAKEVLKRCVTSAKIEDLSSENSVGALIFACGHTNRMHASNFREHLPNVPLGGAYVRGEFGPLVAGGASSVLSHTSAIGIFRKRANAG